MGFRKVAVVAVALLVVLSGCSAFGGSQTDAPTNESNDTGDGTADPDSDGDDSNGTADGTDTDGNDGTDTDGSDGTDDTANAEWSPPQEPNRPLERKDLNEDVIDRIESVEFVDRVPAENGEGYSNFNLEVVANTSMETIDPPEHGTVRGEPYFFVKINQGPGERKIVERTSQVQMREDGRFHIDVRPAGLEEFGEDTLNVEVFLLDEDKDWDDVYDATTQRIHFNPDTGESEADDDRDANETETSENDESETS